MISKILSYGLFAIGWLTVGTPGLASTAKIQTDRQETFVASAALTVNEWVAQIESTEIAAITDIQVSEAAEGITITLISNQPLSAGALRVSGNALIAEIPNATLSLADEAAAEQFEPAEGIALVQTSASSSLPLTQSLPLEIRSSLPSIEEIEAELRRVSDE